MTIPSFVWHHYVFCRHHATQIGNPVCILMNEQHVCKSMHALFVYLECLYLIGTNDSKGHRELFVCFLLVPLLGQFLDDRFHVIWITIDEDTRNVVIIPDGTFLSTTCPFGLCVYQSCINNHALHVGGQCYRNNTYSVSNGSRQIR